MKDRLPKGTELLVGDRALASACESADVVVDGVVGFAGLSVTMRTLELGKRLALANKESLIAAGPVVQAVRSTPEPRSFPSTPNIVRSTSVCGRPHRAVGSLVWF